VSLDVYTRFVVALIVIVALLAVFAWLARRFGFAGRVPTRGARRRLAIVEVTAIDNKRRLILLRRDDVEHLVLVGVDSSVVIETGIVARKPDDFAALVEGAQP
jgi:flagellar protein FliO/FliZ